MEYEHPQMKEESGPKQGKTMTKGRGLFRFKDSLNIGMQGRTGQMIASRPIEKASLGLQRHWADHAPAECKRKTTSFNGLTKSNPIPVGHPSKVDLLPIVTLLTGDSGLLELCSSLMMP